MVKNIILKLFFYKYEPSEGIGMKLLRMVPKLCLIAALVLHFFFIIPGQS